MAQSIPDNFRDLLDKKAFAMLATVMSDGSPQVTPVWVDREIRSKACGEYRRISRSSH